MGRSLPSGTDASTCPRFREIFNTSLQATRLTWFRVWHSTSRCHFLVVLEESLIEQLYDLLDRLCRIHSISADRQFTPLRCSQGQQPKMLLQSTDCPSLSIWMLHAYFIAVLTNMSAGRMCKPFGLRTVTNRVRVGSDMSRFVHSIKTLHRPTLSIGSFQSASLPNCRIGCCPLHPVVA